MLLALIILATACLAVPLLTRVAGRNAGYAVAPVLAVAAVLLLALGATPATEQAWPWMPAIGVELALRLDGLSLLFGLLVTVIGALVLAYAARYLGPGRHTDFFVLMGVFAVSMLALVLADDLVVLFVAWEATTLCSFFLIARSGEHARNPAVRTLLVTALGGLALLAAVVLMAVTTGTTRLSAVLEHPAWVEDSTFATTTAVLLAVAAFTKSAQFPFQSWLPDSMVAITPVSAYLHAAAMVKAGIYLVLRFSPALAETVTWSALLITSGLITALIGAVAALRCTDLKALLASSTVSQLGLLVLMVGVGTPEALTAAVVHTLAHALFKASLFMGVGVIDHQAGTRDLRELAGMRLRMPVTKGLLLVAALSMAGVPPLLGFVSKEGMFAAFLDAPGPAWVPVVVTGGAVLTSALTFGYAGRLVLGAWGARGSGSGQEPVVGEARAAFWGAPALCAAAGTLGLVPFPLDPLVAPAAGVVAGDPGLESDLALWHGLNLALGLSALVLATGAVLVLRRDRVDRALAGARAPVSGLAVVDGARSRLIATGEWVGSWTDTDSPWRHLAIQTSGVVGLGVVGLLLLGTLPPAQDLVRPTDWLLVTLVAVSVLAAVRTASRVGAVVVVGVTGFSIMLWFFALGAPDVAMTQLLVEVLTVCVMVLLLRRLPSRFERTPRRIRPVAAVLALGAGAATVLGVWALTGRRDPSGAARYYLEEAAEETGGANIVNTILVDFRALDTLGELTVLGIAGVTIAALLQSRRAAPSRRSPKRPDLPISDAAENAVFSRTAGRVVGPLTIALSAYLLLRGHQEPGGGFIAALIGGAGVALLYLSAPSDERARVRGPYLGLIGGGVVVGAGTGFWGLAGGSFLQPLPLDVFGIYLSTALVFDVGVYLAVLGVVIAAFTLLGTSADPPGSEPDDTGPADRAGPDPADTIDTINTINTINTTTEEARS